MNTNSDLNKPERSIVRSVTILAYVFLAGIWITPVARCEDITGSVSFDNIPSGEPRQHLKHVLQFILEGPLTGERETTFKVGSTAITFENIASDPSLRVTWTLDENKPDHKSKLAHGLWPLDVRGSAADFAKHTFGFNAY